MIWLVVEPTPLKNHGVRQLGLLFPIWWEKSSIHVPKHQPDMVKSSNRYIPPRALGPRAWSSRYPISGGYMWFCETSMRFHGSQQISRRLKLGGYEMYWTWQVQTFLVAITSPDICPNRSKWNIWFIISSYSRLVVSPFHKSPEDPNPHLSCRAGCLPRAPEWLRKPWGGWRLGVGWTQWPVNGWSNNGWSITTNIFTNLHNIIDTYIYI